MGNFFIFLKCLLPFGVDAGADPSCIYVRAWAFQGLVPSWRVPRCCSEGSLASPPANRTPPTFCPHQGLIPSISQPSPLISDTTNGEETRDKVFISRTFILLADMCWTSYNVPVSMIHATLVNPSGAVIVKTCSKSEQHSLSVKAFSMKGFLQHSSVVMLVSKAPKC